MRLPANPESKRGVVLGEGKPENQNAAIIFCFNEALQSIDMNQVRAWHRAAQYCIQWSYAALQVPSPDIYMHKLGEVIMLRHRSCECLRI